MKNAILLHGYQGSEEYYDSNMPSASNSHWFPWLQKELMINEIKADTPEVFRHYEMKYPAWVEEIERFTINRDSILIGHSMGGGFWVRYLSEHPEIFVDKVILVAPWLNLGHEMDSDFFEFNLDLAITERADEFIIFASDNDKMDIQNSVNYLIEKLPNAKIRTFHEYGHFTQRTLPDNKFPELLEACI